jgi:hypothetical protein
MSKPELQNIRYLRILSGPYNRNVVLPLQNLTEFHTLEKQQTETGHNGKLLSFENKFLITEVFYLLEFFSFNIRQIYVISLTSFDTKIGY